MKYTIGNNATETKQYKQHRKNQVQNLSVEKSTVYQKNITKHCKNGALVASLSLYLKQLFKRQLTEFSVRQHNHRGYWRAIVRAKCRILILGVMS